LVKRTGYKEKAKIYYRDIGDYLKRAQKLSTIGDIGSFLNPEMNIVQITPNEYGDWITERNPMFQKFIPLAAEKKFNAETKSAFVVHSNGMKSQRDIWVYNFSQNAVLGNSHSMIEFYNSQLGLEKVNYDSTRISWSDGLLTDRAKQRHLAFEKDKISLALYRPFQKQWLYHGERVIERRYRFDNIFPTPDAENRVLCVSSIGDTQGFSCLISDSIVDLHCVGTSQCFPLYWYEKSESDGQLFGADGGEQYVRRDGVSDYALDQARSKHGNTVIKEDVFYYVYGILHHPQYREVFADDLKKSLPRIPLVETAEDFWTFSKAGRDLAKLHLEYESVPPLPEIKVTDHGGGYIVTKMKFPTKDNKDTIIYNSNITISNIPPEAHGYIVNGKSAIEWVMERYQVKTDKDSGILNDPNLYAEELGDSKYILNLFLSVIAVSVKTVEIVKALPELYLIGL
jgi:predicted helicase